MCLAENEALDITARTCSVLSYEKLLDDKNDEHGIKRLRARLALPFFRRAVKRARVEELSSSVHLLLEEFYAMERERVPSIDAPSDAFGRVLGEIFSYEAEASKKERYAAVGYHLGRFIYAADALEDEWEDRKKGEYNPYVLLYPSGLGDEEITSIRNGLYLTLDALAGAAEELPFGEKETVRQIILNIVYAGLPDRVERILRERGMSPKQKKKCKKSKESRS